MDADSTHTDPDEPVPAEGTPTAAPEDDDGWAWTTAVPQTE
ncbi:hypothetical protein ACIQGZ_08500 [Streptomyces sp. NPDC092296]